MFPSTNDNDIGMRTFGLIGNPLGHSHSKVYFTNKFVRENIDAQYAMFPLESIEAFPALIENNKELVGLNVTIPYKISILPYLDEVDTNAKVIGAVNTINIERKRNTVKLIGHNTDAAGFEACIKPLIAGRRPMKALILGTGGAAKAVQYALRRLGVGFTMVSRSGMKTGQLSYAMVTSSIIKTHLIIINSSPVGMYPDVENMPDLLYQYINPNHILIDLIYNPEETKFLTMGKMAGALTLNGMTMFERQAEESWKIWNS